MDAIKILQVAVLLMTVGIGILSLLRPQSITGFIGLQAPGPRGLSELRGIFGGLFIGVGLAALLLNSRDAYQVVGIGYLAIAVARTISIVYDRSYDQSNLISAVTEWVSGIILLL